METAAAQHVCTTCQRGFTTPQGLRLHSRKHLSAVEKTEKVVAPVDFTAPAEQGVEMVPPKAPEVKPEQAKYLALPPPVVDHLKRTFGNWLNHFEVGQEYREDFGGYAMYVKVPREFSSEWKELRTIKYDNTTRRPIGEFTEIIPDVRWMSLKEPSKAIQWLDKVKYHVIDNAYRRGIRLPATNLGIDDTKLTRDQYESAIAGQKQPS